MDEGVDTGQVGDGEDKYCGGKGNGWGGLIANEIMRNNKNGREKKPRGS